MKNSNVIITGINGFVGQNLKTYLKEDYKLTGISRNAKSDELTFDFFLRENNIYDAVIHLAGMAHDLRNFHSPLEYYKVNFELTMQVFDEFIKSDAEVFIYVSSVKSIGDEFNGVLNESAIPNPKTHYGISKLLAENYIMKHKIPEKKRIYVLRPCMIHGPGNKGNLNLLYNFVSKGLPWPLGSFENSRSFLSVENLCFVINEILQNKEIPSGIYNLADDCPFSTIELIKLIGISKNKKVIILRIPRFIIRWIARIFELVGSSFDNNRLSKLTDSCVVSNKKIMSYIGKNLPISAAEGFRRTFNSFNERENLLIK